jgi:hypothetical protein
MRSSSSKNARSGSSASVAPPGLGNTTVQRPSFDGRKKNASPTGIFNASSSRLDSAQLGSMRTRSGTVR